MPADSHQVGSQRVRFCRSPDGTTIAYAVYGDGPPLVLDACWLSHLEYDWHSPVWRHYLVELGRTHTVIRFDERGYGLSDRDVTDFSLERRIEDLTAVIEAAGVDRFALMAMAQGGPVALHYVARNPHRVSQLICASTHAGTRLPTSEDDRELEAAFEAMIRAGWDRQDPLFRRVFTGMMIPGATEEQMRWIDDLQQRAVSARTACEARRQYAGADASAILSTIEVPTLVLHSRHERMCELAYGRILAAGIPGARLVVLESANQILLADEPAWEMFLAEVTDFLAAPQQGDSGERPITTLLTGRELDVLRQAARGLDNTGIATTLSLSVRTVERHLQNCYAKLGLHGSSVRTAAVARLLSEAEQPE